MTETQIKDYIVCVAKHEMTQGYVVPNSVIKNCAKCKTDIFVSPSTLRLLEDNNKIQLVCTKCGFEDVDKDTKWLLNPHQKNELEVVFGKEEVNT